MYFSGQYYIKIGVNITDINVTSIYCYVYMGVETHRQRINEIKYYRKSTKILFSNLNIDNLLQL